MPGLLNGSPLGSGHSNILKNREKMSKNTIISVLIDQFSCKNWPIKGGGCCSHKNVFPESKSLASPYGVCPSRSSKVS